MDVKNEQAEWMWRMSEQSGCGEYHMRIYILSRRSKFGVNGAEQLRSGWSRCEQYSVEST